MPNAEPEPSIPMDLDGLTALVNATREQHPDPAERAKALDDLYLRLQGQVQPLMGQVTLDLWLAATGTRTEPEPTDPSLGGFDPSQPDVDAEDAEPDPAVDAAHARQLADALASAPAPVDGSAGQPVTLPADLATRIAEALDAAVEAAGESIEEIRETPGYYDESDAESAQEWLDKMEATRQAFSALRGA